MNVVALTGNLAHFERDAEPVPQVVDGQPVPLVTFTDETWPPRPAMSPRFQARILKVFGWQLVPGYDRYVWIDGQFVPARPDAVAWLLDQLGDADMVFFRHPTRTSAHEEADWIRHRFHRSNRLMTRYTGEWMDEQLAVFEAAPGFVDDRLWAAGLTAYRLNDRVRACMKEWWYHISRYHLNDQLSLPFAAWTTGCRIATIDGDVFHNGYFTWTRGRYHP